MVQNLLIYAFGFATALFLAVAVAPSIWQRAVTLTRRRIEASVPLTLNELQADKDQLRAEFAIANHKLENSAKGLRDRLTAMQVEVTRLHGGMDEMRAEREALAQRLGETESRAADLDAAVRQGLQGIAKLEAQKAELESAVDAGAAELSRKAHEINNLKIDIDAIRIENATRMTEQERISGELTEGRQARKSIEQNLRSTANQLRAAEEAVRVEKRRLSDMEKKSEKLVSQISDRDERLERREKEIARLREQLKAATSERLEFEKRLVATERQRGQLETQNAGLNQRVARLATVAKPGEGEKALRLAEAERQRLREAIERLTREKAALQEQLKAPVTFTRGKDGDNAVLRDKLQSLAALVVAQVAAEEGPQSPVNEILAKAAVEAKTRPSGTSDGTPSLADRIRAADKSKRRA